MAAVECRHLQKSFGPVNVLNDVSIQIGAGEFVVLVGPSGCGKSTLLRIIAGLETPTGGDVLIDGRSVLQLEPRQRHLSMVFQNYALYPHLTVAENLAFGLKLRGDLNRTDIEARVKEVAGTLRIDGLLDRRPRELSGGQRQRVALGRALARKTSLILFDEPLSNLDAALRAQMRYEIKRLHAATGTTILYVTHDQVEATTLGDRIAVLNRGRLEQISPARDIYERPRNRFVASFIGTPEMNFLPGEIAGRPGQILGVRAEDFQIGQGDLQAEFELQEYLGSQSLIHARLRGENIRLLANAPLAAGAKSSFRLSVNMDKAHFFDPQTGARLP